MMFRRAVMSGGGPAQVYFGAGPNQFGECGMAGDGNQWSVSPPNGDSFLPEFVQPRVGGWDQPKYFKMFASMGNHSAFVKGDGTLWTAGYNAFGQLGQGDTTSRKAFTQVGSRTDWVKVGVGTEFSAALDSAGKIWTFGRNDIAAQCHVGDTSTLNVLSPYDTTLTTGISTVTGQAFNPTPMPFFVDMWVGHRFVMGLDPAGDLWTWGNNGSRQLGRGSPDNGGLGYTQDLYCRKIDAVGPWLGGRAGAYSAAAIHRATGEVWMWGLYSKGQRGPGVSAQTPAVVACNDAAQRWVDIACGEYSTFFIRSDGTMWACGQNGSGELGIGSTTDTDTLTQVIGDPGGTNVTSWRFVHCALNHTFGIALDGTLWAWGDNTSKKLGSASLGGASYSSPQLISSDTRWAAAYANQYSSIAVRNAA